MTLLESLIWSVLGIVAIILYVKFFKGLKKDDDLNERRTKALENIADELNYIRQSKFD